MRDYASPVFQHRHYAAIAAVIAGLPPTCDRETVINAFPQKFRGDNGRFDSFRFKAAAEGKPSNGKDVR
jgi:hypothetical protein